MREYFDAYKEMKREERDAVLPGRIAEIEALRAKGFVVVAMNGDRQFRVNGVLDFFPVRRRFHHHKSGQRGGYRNAETVAIRFLGVPK